MSRGLRGVVVGVGNQMRRDDGAGLEVVRRAASRLPDSIVVARCGGDVTALLDLWEGAGLAVVVDAGRWPGAAPGEALWVADAAEWPGPLPGWSDAIGTHGLGVFQVVRLGAAMGRLPARLAVLAVAPGDLGEGAGLSPAVAAGVDRAADILASRVRELLEDVGSALPRVP